MLIGSASVETGEAIAIGIGAAVGGFGSLLYIVYGFAKPRLPDGGWENRDIRRALLAGRPVESRKEALRGAEVAAALHNGVSKTSPTVYIYVVVGAISFAAAIAIGDGSLIVVTGVLALLSATAAVGRRVLVRRLAASERANRSLAVHYEPDPPREP